MSEKMTKDVQNKRLMQIGFVVVLALIVLLMFNLLTSLSNSGTKNIERKEQVNSIQKAGSIPVGVNPYSADSIGKFVARSTYNIDMSKDKNSDSALLRNARPVLTQSLIGKLETSQRASTFVKDTKWDRMRDQGITKWSPSFPVLIDQKQENGQLVSTYQLEVRPFKADSDVPGNPVKITVVVDLQKFSKGWFANNVYAK